MMIAKHFKITELVSEQTYIDRGDNAWQLIDDRLILLIDLLRDEFGSAVINDWLWGGSNQSRGLRTTESDYYRQYSQHSFGRAVDMVFKNHTAQSVRDWLKVNASIVCEKCGIRGFTVEEGVSWLHIDLRNNQLGYNSFYP